MPSYNSARHITQAIQSVLSQSYGHLELLVIDGGSSDGTRNIVKAFADTDDRVRLIENDNDGGPAHARAVGIRSACGAWIAFLDADDYWLPRKLERQIGYMVEREINFCYSKYRRISDDGKVAGCLVPMSARYGYHSALASRGIGTLTVMLRRDLLTEDVISIWRRAGGEELLWWLLILKKGAKAYLLNEDLARYRDTSGSLSKNVFYTLRSVWEMYRKELGLSRIAAACFYLSYIVDSSVRRLRLMLCKYFANPLIRTPA